ncbi:hypothetical protein B0T14DRAFT_569605 [Immersiella caudata]|uniref:Uncharacterized protein n=1 Tax=Immersiella caudata TaxID=314043 RepID=A0AA39WDV4_9PEZI|nr:hypothetical protein B0T14DRAFT_569605 [Immersiella caudata]
MWRNALKRPARNAERRSRDGDGAQLPGLNSVLLLGVFLADHRLVPLQQVIPAVEYNADGGGLEHAVVQIREEHLHVDDAGYIYIPFEFEVPGWFVPQAPKEARMAVDTTLAQATRLQDYELFYRQGQLQKSVMGDHEGYLRTCLSSYLACRGKDAEKQLLAQLKEIDDWTELSAVRAADVHLAKQQIQRILSAKINGQRALPPLRRPPMTY